MGLALVLSLATNIPYVIALMGCVPERLPLWPTTETQLAMSFGNLAVPRARWTDHRADPLLEGVGLDLHVSESHGR